MRAQPRRGKGFVDVRAGFVAQREAAEAMQPGQGAFDNPAEDAEAAAMRTARAWRALDAAGAMDAENAPHRALEIAARFPQAPAALSSCDDFENGQKTPCLRTARTYAILTAPAAGWHRTIIRTRRSSMRTSFRVRSQAR